MPRRKPPTPPPPPPEKEHKTWWDRLTTGERVLTIIGVVGVLVAILAIPDVEVLLHLKKDPEVQKAVPPQGQAQQPTQPPKEVKPDENAPVKPKLKYVPLPNAVPLAAPAVLQAHGSEKENNGPSVSVNGEDVPVMTQADLEKYLDNKGFKAVFKLNPRSGKVDLLVQVGKDGAVDSVQWLSGDKESGEEAKAAIEKWKFKPYTKGGEQVPFETVIQFSPKMSVQYAQEPNHKKDEQP